MSIEIECAVYPGDNLTAVNAGFRRVEIIIEEDDQSSALFVGHADARRLGEWLVKWADDNA
jgi:hypothetical protein